MVKQKRHKVEWVYTQRPKGYNFEKDFGDCVMFVEYDFQMSQFNDKDGHYDFTNALNKSEKWDNFIWEQVNKARENKPNEYTALNVKIVFRPRGRVEHVLERVRRYDQPATKDNPLCSISDIMNGFNYACMSTTVSTYQPEYEEVKTAIEE